jgi:hypothetical protein
MSFSSPAISSIERQKGSVGIVAEGASLWPYLEASAFGLCFPPYKPYKLRSFQEYPVAWLPFPFPVFTHPLSHVGADPAVADKPADHE